MKKAVLPSHIAFLEDKYKFNQELVYLPQSFKEEADQYLAHTGIMKIDLTNAMDVYNELASHFSSQVQ